MKGEVNLELLLKNMTPKLNAGEYVFTVINNLDLIDRSITIFEFKEAEGNTVVLEKNKADNLNLEYEFVAAWITLMVHSSLEAVGLTAVFSNALAKHNMSCNVVAGYYHDHIFVDINDVNKAMNVLKSLTIK